MTDATGAVSGAAAFELAVICVTHNSAAQIPDFAAGLTRGLGRSTSVVVFVDSGSSDTTVDVIRVMLPDAQLLMLGANRGFAAGINAGVHRVVELGGAAAYAIVNPDMSLGADCLPRLAAALSQPGIGIAAPNLHDEHGALLPSMRRRPRVIATWCEAIAGGPVAARLGLPTEVIRDPTAYLSDRNAGWATGGMVMVSSRCWNAIGGWDESFFMYEEEVDFCLRAADAGFALRYVAAATATREIGPGPVAPWAQALMRANRVELVRRRSGRAVALATRLGLLVGESIRAISGRPSARAAVWALLAVRSPADVMARYRPSAQAVVG